MNSTIEICEDLTQNAINMIKNNFTGFLDLFAPEIHNMVMEKKLNNAIKAIEGIKSKLEEYGLQVDYKRYFEQKLQIPLMAVRALSEVNSEEQIEMLKNLFIRHLTEKYKDDSFYPAFIEIIKTFTPIEVTILNQISKNSDLQTFLQDNNKEKLITINPEEIKKELGISDLEFDMAMNNLERNQIVSFLYYKENGDIKKFLTALGLMLILSCKESI